MTLVVRPATPADAAVVHGFIRDLAEYEKLLPELEATETDTAAALFGPRPRVFCDLAELDGEAVGFALWFYSFSTFRGRHGIYLEDLFVRPQARGTGAGRALLRTLARRCDQEDLARLEWSVLDWNQLAIDFYDRLGAASKTGWITRQLTGEALERLAAEA